MLGLKDPFISQCISSNTRFVQYFGMVILVVSVKCMIHKMEFLVYYSSNECVQPCGY